MYNQRRKRGEIFDRDLIFIFVIGDGGNDIGMGFIIGAVLRNYKMIIFEYDNGGYMNIGYQFLYIMFYGVFILILYVGKVQFGKLIFYKDIFQIMAVINVLYVVIVVEFDFIDFVKKVRKVQKIMREEGFVYIKVLLVCLFNWGDELLKERRVIQAVVDCCFYLFYEIDYGKIIIIYDFEKKGKKIFVIEWFLMMGRIKYFI